MENNITEQYPVKLEINYPERSSRILALLGILFFFPKMILLVPHMIVIYVLNIASFVAIWFGFWAVLFTGKYPKSFFNFITGVVRWQTRMSAWMYGLTDKYPPFSLE
jgi:hypothetical protein